MEKGREVLSPTANDMSKVAIGTSNRKEGGGRSLSWNQALKGSVCKIMKLHFICEATRTHRRILNKRVIRLGLEMIPELCGLEKVESGCRESGSSIHLEET